MYAHNNKDNNSCFYAHFVLYSPNVPVFKNDQGELLDQYYEVDMISSPAVNAGAVKKKKEKELGRKRVEELIEEVMKERMQRVLDVALIHRADVLILGAFGCGVFKNNPKNVATWWKELLVKKEHENGDVEGLFDDVFFAVFDKEEGDSINAFQQVFATKKETQSTK